MEAIPNQYSIRVFCLIERYEVLLFEALSDAATQPDLYGGNKGKKMCMLVGTNNALRIAVETMNASKRNSKLKERLIT